MPLVLGPCRRLAPRALSGLKGDLRVRYTPLLYKNLCYSLLEYRWLKIFAVSSFHYRQAPKVPTFLITDEDCSLRFALLLLTFWILRDGGQGPCNAAGPLAEA